VPYRAGPLQNYTAAASPLPPNARLQLSLSLVRLAACFSHLRTRAAPGRQIGGAAGGFFIARPAAVSCLRPQAASWGRSAGREEASRRREGISQPPSSSPALRPASSTAWQQPRRGELQAESLQSRAPIPPRAALWGRPAGREEASCRREGGIRKQLEATRREGGSQPRGGRNPRAVEATGSRGPARAPGHLLALKFLTAATVSSRQGA
jgi:hypothetical protein